MNKFPRSVRYTLSKNSRRSNSNLYNKRSETPKMEVLTNSYSNDYYSPLNNNFQYAIKNTSASKNNNNFRVESTKEATETTNKNEAKELIEQTKRMMEEYKLNKLKKNNRYNNLTQDININNETLCQIKNPRLDFNSDPNSLNSLTQKLICKNKEIKVLERLLKEKTNQLKTAQDKLAAKNDEIKKIYENLEGEKCNTLKVENIKLNKKIFNLEKEKTELHKNYEKNINDLRIKINNLTKELTNFQSRNKELENNITNLVNDNDNLKTQLNEKTNLSLTLKEKNNIEKKSNENYKNEINDLKTSLSNIIVVLKTLFSKEGQIYEKRDIFLNKLNFFVQSNNNTPSNSIEKSLRNSNNFNTNIDYYNEGI